MPLRTRLWIASWLAFLGIFFVVGCTLEAEKVDAPKEGVKVETLFTDSDGWTVKRFRDGDSGFQYYAVKLDPVVPDHVDVHAGLLLRCVRDLGPHFGLVSVGIGPGAQSFANEHLANVTLGLLLALADSEQEGANHAASDKRMGAGLNNDGEVAFVGLRDHGVSSLSAPTPPPSVPV